MSEKVKTESLKEESDDVFLDTEDESTLTVQQKIRRYSSVSSNTKMAEKLERAKRSSKVGIKMIDGELAVLEDKLKDPQTNWDSFATKLEVLQGAFKKLTKNHEEFLSLTDDKEFDEQYAVLGPFEERLINVQKAFEKQRPRTSTEEMPLVTTASSTVRVENIVAGLNGLIDEVTEDIRKDINNLRTKFEGAPRTNLSGFCDSLQADLTSIQNRMQEWKNDVEKRRNHLLDIARADIVRENGLNEKDLCEQFERIEKTVSQFLKSTVHSQPSETLSFVPKRDLIKFDGDLRNWLAFKASFEDIHADPHHSPLHKFQLLRQSMIKGSESDRLVSAYPLSAEVYESAYKALTDRYDRNNLLIKFYVRELLKMVIDNVTGKRLPLADLVNQMNMQLANLGSLGLEKDKYQDFIFPLVESCLPEDILINWQRRTDREEEELDKLMEFLHREVNDQMERKLAKSSFSHFEKRQGTSTGRSQEHRKNPTHSTSSRKPTAASFAVTDVSKKQRMCVFCDGSHYSNGCPNAAKMTMEKRKELLVKAKICAKCLRQLHKNKCPITPLCVHCAGSHFFQLCPSANPKAEHVSQEKDVSPESKEKSKDSAALMSNQSESINVPLQTLMATSYGPNGEKKDVRVMFDSGSQRSYILTDVALKLGLKVQGNESVTHLLFGGKKSKETEHPIFKLEIGCPERINVYNFDVRGISNIASRILAPKDGRWIDELRKEGVTLSDIHSEDGPIDVLIGNDVRANLFTGKKIVLGYGPVAEETVWGWVLSGKLPASKADERNETFSSMNVVSMNVADRPVEDLWSLDTIGIRDAAATQTRAEIEAMVQQHFDETINCNPDGRYEVALPFIAGCKDKLANNFSSAHRRLKTVTAKLDDDGLTDQYSTLFDQWEKDKMIEPVQMAEITMGNTPAVDGTHYLPHRAVVKLTSSSTPVRPVFDASAKQKGYLSLNECVDKGSNLLELIPSLLTKFRLERVGVIADIKKAFQQISVRPTDRDYLRFLWWEDNSRKRIKVYRHTRVVFGVSCSPYLLAATLRHHIHLYKSNILSMSSSKRMLDQSRKAEIAEALLNSLYVDNCVISLPSIKDAENFKDESRAILDTAKFDLRAWEFGPDPEGGVTHVLGLLWDRKDDTLAIDITAVLDKLQEMKPTQRMFLAVLHSLYDPQQIISPFLIRGKEILRRCHEIKSGWDKELPEDIQKDIRMWTNQIPVLKDIRIPRYTFFGEATRVSLHVFCDASNTAYATAAFLRVEYGEFIRCSLLHARSRVAPLKGCSIPRLELLSCLIGARLMTTVLEDIGQKDVQIYLWSDSATALTWITKDGPWNVFVNNRVKEIRNLTSTDMWRHVPGRINPADLPSRGCGAKKLVESKWWEGPSWLYEPEQNWPSVPAEPDPEVVRQETKKVVITQIATTQEDVLDRLLRLSVYPKILRTISIWRRYLAILKDKMLRRRGHKAGPGNNLSHTLQPVSSQEMDVAEVILLRYIQQPLMTREREFKRLHWKEDKDGVLRVITRLTHEDTDDFKFPVVLPNKCPFVDRLIRWEHQKAHHAGTKILLGLMREKYWVISGARTIRRILNHCWICRRWTSRKVDPKEAALPSSRTTTGAPFNVTGVDAAGPLFLRRPKGGDFTVSKSSAKAWVILFTCATYRAIHLELIPSLSTDDFLQAFRRFVARQGRPSVIYSDNGLNFVGAQRAMVEVNWDAVLQYAAVNRIEWRFNPPTGAWWGGFWERMIGLTKDLLRKVLGHRSVHYGELWTLLVEVEGIINSRPLTSISEHPDDVRHITPNHYIRAAESLVLPEVDEIDSRHAKAAFKKLQILREALRSRFRKEYLGALIQRRNVKHPQTLKIGDVVLIEDTNRKRLDWPLAVITGTIPGKDGETRVYRVKWRGGETTRPAQRLYPMELTE